MNLNPFATFLPVPNVEEVIQPLLVPYVTALAEQVAEGARGAAPVLTGDYRDSIKAEVGYEDGKLVARVNAYDYKAWWIEAGTEDTRAFAPLATGAELAGLVLEAETPGAYER